MAQSCPQRFRHTNGLVHANATGNIPRRLQKSALASSFYKSCLLACLLACYACSFSRVPIRNSLVPWEDRSLASASRTYCHRQPMAQSCPPRLGHTNGLVHANATGNIPRRLQQSALASSFYKSCLLACYACSFSRVPIRNFLSLGRTDLLHLRPAHIAIANLWRKAAHQGLGIRMAWCMQMLRATYHGVFSRVR